MSCSYSWIFILKVLRSSVILGKWVHLNVFLDVHDQIIFSHNTYSIENNVLKEQ